MAKSPEQLARSFRGFASDAKVLDHDVVNATALEGKTVIGRELRRAAPNLKLSGVGKRGARIGVRYDQGKTQGTALLRATGPVHLIESDTKAHRIPKERKRGRRRLVVIPGVGPRAHAQHPGTRGKHPWAKGVAAFGPKVPRIVQAETHKAMARHFGGG